jgi:hypothetical protein
VTGKETHSTIKLIITASDPLYEALSEKVRAEGQVPRRARNVLQGFEQAMRLGEPRADRSEEGSTARAELAGIIVDMSLRAADTLLEALHSRPSTSSIPLMAVKCDSQVLPLALRRLCTDVLELNGLAPPGAQGMREP